MPVAPGKAKPELHALPPSAIPFVMLDAGNDRSMKLFQWIQQQAGLSRRKAQELIAAGEIDVNSVTVLDPFLPLRSDAIHRLSIRGHPLSLEAPDGRIYRFHKPAGMLCSHDDPHHGNTVGRLLRAEGFIGYTWVGRLDQDAEGLLLLSNEGRLIQAFTHPRHEIVKTYHVWFKGSAHMAEAFDQMRRGIVDEGEPLRVREARMEGRPPYAVLTLAEGRKHEIKRLFAHFDLDVTRLLRVAVGPVELGRLPAGQFERISDAEELFALAEKRLAEAGGPPSVNL
jgi:23S rRNA pseudouridine2605 synthase